MTEQAVWIYVTAPDETVARHLAVTLVEERLAACANILGPISSVYWWDGKVNCEAEIAIFFKTMGSSVAALSERAQALHPYECPCIIALPICGGNPDFLRWIATEISPAAKPSP